MISTKVRCPAVNRWHRNNLFIYAYESLAIMRMCVCYNWLFGFSIVRKWGAIQIENQTAHTLIESTIRSEVLELFLLKFQPGSHWLRPFQKSVAAFGDAFFHGFSLSLPWSGKYPFIPPTAKFNIIWNWTKINEKRIKIKLSILLELNIYLLMAHTYWSNGADCDAFAQMFSPRKFPRSQKPLPKFTRPTWCPSIQKRMQFGVHSIIYRWKPLL